MTSHKKRTELKKQLKRAGYTQESAAEKCDVSREHLNHVLSGRRESARLIAKIEELVAPEEAEA